MFVIDKDNKARLRVVQLAARDRGETTRIVSGISDNDRVATSNLAELYEGADVTVASGQ